MRSSRAKRSSERRATGPSTGASGRAVGPALAGLVADVDAPEVLFSSIKSPPRTADERPSHVVRWAAGRGLFGERVELPDAACVTSRWDPSRPTTPRYALVCATCAAVLASEPPRSLRSSVGRMGRRLTDPAPLAAAGSSTEPFAVPLGL